MKRTAAKLYPFLCTRVVLSKGFICIISLNPTISGGRDSLFREKGTEKLSNLSNAEKWETTKHRPQALLLCLGWTMEATAVIRTRKDGKEVAVQAVTCGRFMNLSF